VDEQRALTAKGGGHHHHRPELCFSQKVSDLQRGIETDGFDSPDGHELHLLQPCHPGHHFRNALRHGIGFCRLTPDWSGDEDSGSKTRLEEARRALEEKVVRVEVLYEDDIAWRYLLRTHEALPYMQHPEPTCHRPYEQDQHEQRQPELPRR